MKCITPALVLALSALALPALASEPIGKFVSVLIPSGSSVKIAETSQAPQVGMVVTDGQTVVCSNGGRALILLAEEGRLIEVRGKFLLRKKMGPAKLDPITVSRYDASIAQRMLNRMQLRRRGVERYDGDKLVDRFDVRVVDGVVRVTWQNKLEGEGAATVSFQLTNGSVPSRGDLPLQATEFMTAPDALRERDEGEILIFFRVGPSKVADRMSIPFRILSRREQEALDEDHQLINKYADSKRRANGLFTQAVSLESWQPSLALDRIREAEKIAPTDPHIRAQSQAIRDLLRFKRGD